MADGPYQVSTAQKCPICGGAIVAGCLYGGDSSPLQWLAGPAEWLKNMTTGLGRGLQVGECSPTRGPYAEGLRCDACQIILLEYSDMPEE